MPGKPHKIGEVARGLGISERRIREYERAKLIRPMREPATGDRLFTPTDVAQLKVIQDLIHRHGFTLEALREVLRYASCWELTQCELKESCPAFQNPGIPCYEQRAGGAPMPRQADCARCPIYQSKAEPRPAIVIRSHGEPSLKRASS